MGIFDIFNNDAQMRAAGAQIGGINQGVGQALPWYEQGIGSLQQYYGNAAQDWNPIIGAGNAGLTAYGNAVGANGPQGTAAALKAFQASPQYQFQKQQGLAGVNAAQAAAGGTGSGTADVAAANYASNLAGTGWQNYISSLAPYMGLAAQGAQGQAGVYQNLGGGLNAAQQGIGNMYYGADTSIGNANANAWLGNLTGSANLWGLGSNLLGGALGFGRLGGGGGGGSMFTSPFTLSDAKLKEDIEPVGKLADDQTVYRYRFKGDPRFHIGLIAQEVEGAAPEAVAEVLPDLRMVDYRRATDRAAEILKFTREPFESPPTVRPYANELMSLAA